jgi:hypothetical protein
MEEPVHAIPSDLDLAFVIPSSIRIEDLDVI